MMKMLEIILEGRVENFQARYANKFSPQTIENIVNVAKEVPGGTKFLEFMGRVLPNNIAQGLLDEKVKSTLKKFVSVGPNLEKKDINQYDSFAELFGAIEAYENRIRRDVKTIEGADLVYEDERFTVVAPLTVQASCYYGAGTKWCTASSANNSHFGNYMTDGKLFYILDKTKPSSDRFYKVALLKKFEGGETFYDAPDQSFTVGWIFDTPVLQKIRNSIDVYMKDKYKKELEIFADKERARLERERIAREQKLRQQQAMIEVANERRENDDWNPENIMMGDEGSLAQALFKSLVDNNEFEEKTPESQTRIEEVKSQLQTLQQTYDDIENADEMTDLVSEIEDLEEELEELNKLKDVYDIIPLDYSNYDLKAFTTTDFNKKWLVGDSVQTEETALDTVRSLVDDIGLEGFTPSFVESHIDYDEYEKFLDDFFGEDIRNNPEIYLDDDDKTLSRKQEAEIQELKERISQLTDEMENLDDEDEDYDDERSNLESEIEDLNNEIEEIEQNPDGEYDDDKIEDAISSRVSEYSHNIQYFVSDFFGTNNVTQFMTRNGLVDLESFIQDVVDTDGYGITINSYDGSVDEVRYNGDTYYIFYDGDY